MKERFAAAQISRVIDQALIYQCACPAQVCRAIFELRELYAYQTNCAADSVNDRQVHETIAQATADAHQLMEQCLARVLALEQWDLDTLDMPMVLRKKPVRAI